MIRHRHMSYRASIFTYIAPLSDIQDHSYEMISGSILGVWLSVTLVCLDTRELLRTGVYV